ncbi:NAD(P)/FAD-dependent oxidoreductase [Pseudooceanicola sp. 200-1SW]|uniref:NAD(P)/FAD-dependent oxidoreductase n=1 Tax=Pseudooceanicola sp. 200-1SW TaxID=3425949 RepID=UPI003D7FC230
MTSDGNLWRASSVEGLATTPLAEDLRADLVVIGAGFTGAACALEAAKQGASVVLLEANTIAHGGSGRNVGLVNAGLWLPPDEVLAQMGEADGARLVEALGQGPQMVFDRVAEHGIACEATRNGTLHLAHSPKGFAELQDRFRQGNRHGAPLQLLDAEETARRTGSAAFHGALLDPRAGTVQPLAYCTGLARAAQGLGARVHENSPVTAIAHGDGLWTVTANGHNVRAPKLLLATNAYHEGIAGAFAPQFVVVNYSQFATAPLPEAARAKVLPGAEGCWDTALVMSSIRLDAAGRLIVGGMGNAEGLGRAVHAGWARRKLRALYPDLGDLPFEHQWRGKIAMTRDHIPKVVNFGPSAYAVFGYSGRGISPGTVFGTAAAQALLRDDPAAFPLPVMKGYKEHLRGLHEAYYEFGATLTHATMRPR